jgi:hypothetical protein
MLDEVTSNRVARIKRRASSKRIPHLVIPRISQSGSNPSKPVMGKIGA